MSWIKQIIIFELLSNIIIHLLPNNRFIKYVKLFTGLILILITINPLLHLFNIDEVMDNLYGLTNSTMLNKNMKSEMVLQGGNYEDIIKPYQEEITENISEIVNKNNMYLVNANIEINTSSESDSFGQIEEIRLDISRKYNTSDINIKKINISKNDAAANINIKNIINEVSEFYGLDKSQVKVNSED